LTKAGLPATARRAKASGPSLMDRAKADDWRRISRTQISSISRTEWRPFLLQNQENTPNSMVCSAACGRICRLCAPAGPVSVSLATSKPATSGHPRTRHPTFISQWSIIPSRNSIRATSGAIFELIMRSYKNDWPVAKWPGLAGFRWPLTVSGRWSGQRIGGFGRVRSQ